jgi:hypothetical protein
MLTVTTGIQMYRIVYILRYDTWKRAYKKKEHHTTIEQKIDQMNRTKAKGFNLFH